ncbi:hypothetical protein AAVH_23023 [Aphelenchoides avenae]|nr:hypothetical protein AAVH_23023 [Aphelenchus avenae]
MDVVDFDIHQESNLCCWGKVHVRHAGLIVAIFAFMTALFDLFLLSSPLIGIPLIISDLAAGCAGIYAFCMGRGWAWLPLMILNILKTVLYAFFASLSLIVLFSLIAVYTEYTSDDGKQLAQILLIVGAAVTVGYVLAGCLSAWFARLAYRTFVWQRSNGLRTYQSCAADKGLA